MSVVFLSADVNPTSAQNLAFLFFFTDTATTEIYTLSLHDALPISPTSAAPTARSATTRCWPSSAWRSEEHTSELQSRENLVCRLLLEKKNKKKIDHVTVVLQGILSCYLAERVESISSIAK